MALPASRRRFFAVTFGSSDAVLSVIDPPAFTLTDPDSAFTAESFTFSLASTRALWPAFVVEPSAIVTEPPWAWT